MRAGVSGVNFMVFRHSWATEAELQGVADDKIQAVLRHTTPLTSKQFYRHAAVAGMRPAVDVVNFAPPATTPKLRIIGART